MLSKIKFFALVVLATNVSIILYFAFLDTAIKGQGHLGGGEFIMLLLPVLLAFVAGIVVIVKKIDVMPFYFPYHILNDHSHYCTFVGNMLYFRCEYIRFY